MSSTNKFATGLNNWSEYDKPERLDFVSDNSILDQNVMWKDDYDQTGEVGEIGIALYVEDYVDNSLGIIEDTYAFKSVSIDVLLTALGWSGSSPYTQAISVPGLSSDSNGILSLAHSATDIQSKAAREAMIRVTGQGINTLTITADGDKPLIDIPLSVMIVG